MANKISAFEDPESIGLVAASNSNTVFDEPDEDLAPLLSQLQNHLDSIKANTSQVVDIERKMLRVRAALITVPPNGVT